MVLTSSKRKELHDNILDYLRQNGFERTVEVLEQELQVVSIPSPVPETQLERKYSSVIRMSRQLIDRDERIKELEKKIEEMADPTSVVKLQHSRDYLPSSRPLHTLEGHLREITSLSFHPTQPLFCSAADDGRVKVWDYECGECTRTVIGHSGAVKCVAIDPQGKYLATSSDDTEIRIYDWNTGTCLRTLIGHQHSVSCIEWVPGSQELLSASRDSEVKLWSTEVGNCLQTYRGNSEWVRVVRVSRKGTVVVTAGDDKVIRMTRLPGMDQTKIVGCHDHDVECLAFANLAGDEYLTSLVESGDADAPNGNGTASNGRSPSPPPAEATKLDSLPDSRFLASGGRDKMIYIWDLSNCSKVFSIRGHDDWVRGLVFHINGKGVISCSDDGDIVVWNIRDGRAVRRLHDAHSNNFVSAVAYHPVGKYLVSGAVDNTVKVWKCE